MGGYVSSTKLEGLTFEGEPVTGTLEQLGLPDLLKLQGADVATDEDAAKVLAEIIPSYVKDFSGPKKADGSPVTIAEVCAKAYFIEIVLELGRKLVQAARPPSQPSGTSAS